MDRPNEKWQTDVAEFHYVGTKNVIHKVFVSAIIDLYDRRIVAYVIGDSNNNSIVYKTFKAAVAANPDTRPIFHSDRGFQYTNRVFHTMLEDAGMTQSMSRIGKPIDNGPMNNKARALLRKEIH